MLDNCDLKIEKVIGDLNDINFISEIMSGVDKVMHIYNIHHSPIIVREAIKNKVKRLILIHTTGIYSNFKDASKRYKEIENEINELNNKIENNLEITILRPTMIYGDMCDSNMSKFIKMVDKLKIMPVIDGGKSLIQPVNARDLGKAYYDVLTSPEVTSGKAYDLSGDRPIKIIKTLELISNELNKKTRFISIPLLLGVFLAKLVKIITFKKINYVEKVQRMSEDRSYSHVAASKDFDYNPMSFEKGISIEVSQYLKERDN